MYNVNEVLSIYNSKSLYEIYFLDIQDVTLRQGAHWPTRTQLIFRFFLIAANDTAFPKCWDLGNKNVIFYFQLLQLQKKNIRGADMLEIFLV